MPAFVQANVGVANLGLSAQISIGTPPTQNFRTIPVANNRLSLYSLAIRSPGQGYGLVAGYTFPISPANIRKEFTALTNFYDVAGTPDMLGVQRIVDVYGQSPVIYTIEGTTGWKRHSTDGYSLTGLDSIRALESTLEQFSFLNAAIAAQQQGLPLYTLEFYDYFRNDYWQVVPFGPQLVRQSRTRPLFVDYLFRLVGVQDLSDSIGITDPFASLFVTLPTVAASVMINFGVGFSTLYGGLTLGIHS